MGICGAAFLYWAVAMKLSQIQTDTMALLHDNNYLFNSQNQIIRWINEARYQCAKRTGCIRKLITGQSAFGASAQPGYFIPSGGQPGALPGAFPAGTVQGAAVNTLQTIPGVERYPFNGFFNPYAQQEYGGVKGVIDAVALSVNWGGSIRPSIYWLPWDELQAYARAYATLVTSYPYYWSVYNDGDHGEIWMFPTPSFAGDIELDALCVPIDIYTDSDIDAIPENYQDTIKFLAASLAFAASERYSQALLMESMWQDRVGIGGVARDRGKVPNYYYGVP